MLGAHEAFQRSAFGPAAGPQDRQASRRALAQLLRRALAKHLERPPRGHGFHGHFAQRQTRRPPDAPHVILHQLHQEPRCIVVPTRHVPQTKADEPTLPRDRPTGQSLDVLKCLSLRRRQLAHQIRGALHRVRGVERYRLVQRGHPRFVKHYSVLREHDETAESSAHARVCWVGRDKPEEDLRPVPLRPACATARSQFGEDVVRWEKQSIPTLLRHATLSEDLQLARHAGLVRAQCLSHLAKRHVALALLSHGRYRGREKTLGFGPLKERVT